MRRMIMEKLYAWKANQERKPLILWGARQVGKTWSLQRFGEECFDNTVYISFYNNKKMEAIFERDYDIRRIISDIEIELHTEIDPQNTLIIFDEVQGAPKVVEALKYFCEDGRAYHVAAAGSLLGVALHQGVSFPVGKVDGLHLYPMNFTEFLWALGEERLAQALAEPGWDPINDHADRYIELLKQYYVVGGMPEVVKGYRQDRSVQEARVRQLAIIEQFEGDFGKHIEPRELPRTKMTWQSIPLQLAKENHKFMYGKIRKGARAKDYEIALEWLVDAGLIYRIHKVTKPAMPLKAYMDPASFKVYMIDVGLLGALSELDPESVLRGGAAFTEFKGALAEQYVLQELIATGSMSLYYFAADKGSYEVDFLYQKEGDVIPLEVKAETNLKAKSLRYYVDKYSPAYAVRTSMAGFRMQDWLINMPLWAVQRIAFLGRSG